MTISDWIMIIAILLAPLIAVHVQKRLENFREERWRKLQIFKTLMATRAATVSAEHVRALNMIDLEFLGKKYRNVTTAWKTYLDHLANYPKDDKDRQAIWGEKRVDFLASLLMHMGRSLGYNFDEVHVKRGIYAPEAHAQIEDELMFIRRGLIRLLYGDAGIKMDVTSFPINEDTLGEQKDIRKGLQELLDGRRSFPVSITNNKEN